MTSRYTTALHEAAHAVVQAIQGLHPCRVSILPGDGYSGIARFSTLYIPGHTLTAMSDLAGYAIESLLQDELEEDESTGIFDAWRCGMLSDHGIDDFLAAEASGEDLEVAADKVLDLLSEPSVLTAVRAVAAVLLEKSEITEASPEYALLYDHNGGHFLAST